MLFVNRRARKSNERASSHGYFQPRCEGLEAKVLLTIDLGGSSARRTTPTSPAAPFGIDFGAGTIPNIPTASSHAAGRASPTWETSTATDMKTSPSPRPALAPA